MFIRIYVQGFRESCQYVLTPFIYFLQEINGLRLELIFSYIFLKQKYFIYTLNLSKLYSQPIE